MTIDRRTFCGDTDIQAMIELALDCPSSNAHVLDLPYRLSSWALDNPDNAALWFDATGRLRAWAVMQTPFWAIDYTYDAKGGAPLHRELLNWADDCARRLLGTLYGRRSWYVMAFADQASRIDDLEKAGVVCQSNAGEDSWSKVLMQRPAEMPVAEHALPAGYIIRPLAGEKEVAAYVQLHRAVFKSRNMTSDWRARTLRCPEYAPDLDLVAAGPDERLVAFCVTWLSRSSEGTPTGQIEPLGVHPHFRALGLGGAILSEALRRLYLHGAATAYVETDQYRNSALDLYKAAGFRPTRDILIFRKDYGQAHG